MTDQLYEQDYALWLDRTVEALKNRELEAIDWQNLIEEVESLAGKDRRELENRLTTLFEHALKRKYTSYTNDYRGWVSTIVRCQRKILLILEQSPSLRPFFVSLIIKCYTKALSSLGKESSYTVFSFPADYPFPQDPDRLLNDIFWE